MRNKLIGFSGFDGSTIPSHCKPNDVTLECGCPGAYLAYVSGDLRYCTPDCPPQYVRKQDPVTGGTICYYDFIVKNGSSSKESSIVDANGDTSKASTSFEKSGMKYILFGLAIAGVVYLVMKP